MTDRVYPSSKATANGTTNPAGGNPSFPANKSQLYNATRPAYRPKPPPRSRRSCCCSCCLWTTFIIIVIILLTAIAGAIFWVIYRPRRPSFSVSSLQLSQFNLTTSSQLTSKFNFTVSARNPNKKIIFFYDPITVAVTSDGVDVGDGTFSAFEHGTKNTTMLMAAIASVVGQNLDSTAASTLRSDLKNKNSLPLMIQLDTKVKVKVGGLKSKKVRIRVICDGIEAGLPRWRSGRAATTSDAKCNVDLRIKIWKWAI